ncbi:MAG: hypothetical protein PHS45_03440 [Bacilli bacterium]|nr:hypothetical protein [Bacilli bacterium]
MVGTKEIVTLDILINEGHISAITDNNNVPCNNTDSYVEVTKVEAGGYIYNVRLVCNNYDSLMAWSEWSDWTTVPPSGQQIEVEEDILYNYQEMSIYYSDWSIWEDVAYDNQLKQVAEFIGMEKEEKTVYRYQDQEWLWYNQANESVCSSDTPTGAGWVKGDACDSAPESVCSAITPAGDGWIQGSSCGTETSACISSSPGDDWTQGSSCAHDSSCTATSPGVGWTKGSSCGTETSTCRSSSPGTGWTISDACSWNETTTTCAIDGTGSACAYTTESSCSASSPGTGWTKGSACDSTTATSCQYASPGTGYVKGSGCGTETSACKSSSPGAEWTASTACTRQHSMVSACQSSAPNRYWTAGTICTRNYSKSYCSGVGGCLAGELDAGPAGCSYSRCITDSRSCLSSSPGTGWDAGDVCTRKWNWSGCHSDGTGTICTRKYTRPQYNWTKTTDTKWAYTRDVASKWYKTATSCSTSGSGSACKWFYTSPQYTYTIPTSWYFTRPEYTYSRVVDTKWTYTSTATNYTVDYYSEAPIGYPNKDEAKTRLTSWTDWADPPPTIYTYRTIESKDQFRTRNKFKDWSGYKLSKYVTKEELETLLGMTLEEIKNDPSKEVTSVTMYRYRTRVY